MNSDGSWPVTLKSHWHHAIVTFLTTVLGAGIFLPLVRVQPASVHEYFNGVSDWIRVSFAFTLCVFFTILMFKVLSPRAGQLKHCRTHPPAWLASILAWIVVGIVDLLGGFDSDGFRAKAWEWILYGGGAFGLVGWYTGFFSEFYRSFRTIAIDEPVDETNGVTLQKLENAPWEEIEAWLESDEPAQYDFLGHQAVAQRVSFHVSEGTRSIGIVAPYGAGKTSIVEWVKGRLKRHQVGGRRYFVCIHSCWGFETSASAIHSMLASAISEVSAEIDTFQIDSLPENYQQMFSAGGDWAENLSNLVLDKSNPMDQFSHLSKLLGEIGGRLVVVVEDLDRGDTQGFEIQEVLAFLERLKAYSNFSFILTGGLNSSRRIDYAKLCDHIEYLRTIQTTHLSGLVERVRGRCLDTEVFRHLRLGEPAGNHQWSLTSGLMMRNYEEYSLPAAVALLLSTPRSLRHVLGRTYRAWCVLHGEIDLNHLLAVNVLRFGAPESFQFLIRRWDRLRSLPNRSARSGPERIGDIRNAIIEDWNCTIRNVDWNSTAALQVLESILPATKYWLVNSSLPEDSHTGRQQVCQERYWIRAINEAIESDDIRDQEVIRDIQAWIESPSSEADLVRRLTESSKYSDVWATFAPTFLRRDRENILLLCEQVIQRILSNEGAAATGDLQGFTHTWSYTLNSLDNPEANARWLQMRIEEAARVSLKMAHDIWYYYGSTDERFVRDDDMPTIRRHMLETVRANIVDTDSLIARLSVNSSVTLFHLIFDPGQRENAILADAQTWRWLAPMILDGVRRRDVAVVANCGILLGRRRSVFDEVAVNSEILDQFFGDNASEVIDILDSMIDQLPQPDQLHTRETVHAAREYLRHRIVTDEQGGVANVD